KDRSLIFPLLFKMRPYRGILGQAQGRPCGPRLSEQQRILESEPPRRVAFLFGENFVTRDEVIAAIRKASAKLGHVPSIGELVKSSKVTRPALRKLFRSYREAWQACGLDRQSSGYKVELSDLFLDWAGVVRKLGKAPTIAVYNKHSRYSCVPLIRHYGGWSQVPAGLLAYAGKAGLQEQWKDVLDIVAAHRRGPHGKVLRMGRPGGIRRRRRI